MRGTRSRLTCSSLSCLLVCVLQCVSAVCCSVLQLQLPGGARHVSPYLACWYVCVAVCCISVLQCVAVCCSVLQFVATRATRRRLTCPSLSCWLVCVCCSVLQCVAVWCSVVQHCAVCCNPVWCSVLQVFCSYSYPEALDMCLSILLAGMCVLQQCVAVCCSVL